MSNPIENQSPEQGRREPQAPNEESARRPGMPEGEPRDASQERTPPGTVPSPVLPDVDPQQTPGVDH